MVSTVSKNSPSISYHGWYFILKIYLGHSVLNQKKETTLTNLFSVILNSLIKFSSNE